MYYNKIRLLLFLKTFLGAASQLTQEAEPFITQQITPI